MRYFLIIRYILCAFLSNRTERNAIEAFSNGSSEMIPVVAGILASLIATLSLLAMVNSTLTWFGDRVGSNEDITLEVKQN